MDTKRITLLFLILFSRMICNGQGMTFEEDMRISNADYGTCYNIGNYMLCPEKKLIRVGRMFGTAAKDCFGYFPDSNLSYNKDTMIIFGGNVFFDKSNLHIDWMSVELLAYGKHSIKFTDRKSVFYMNSGSKEIEKIGKYDKNNCKSDIKKRLQYRKDYELTESFYVRGKKIYFNDIPVYESFNVSSLHIIVSKRGFETNYITDGKQVIFGGGKTSYSTTKKNGKEYVLVKEWMIKGVDLPSLRVLGRDLLCDKNALYCGENVIPFNKLNGLKLFFREL